MPLLKRRYLPAAIIAAVFLALGLPAWRLYNPPALYRITILPSLGGVNTIAERLNDHGQVVGRIYDHGYDRPFLWDRTHGIQDLGFPGVGLRINNAGQIAGTMRTDAGIPQAFLWEPGEGVTMLGTLGGKASSGNAINNRGQIVGESTSADGSSHAFLWERETGMTELNAPDGSRYVPRNITDAGQILVMQIKPSQVQPPPWFLLDPNGPMPLGALPQDTWPHSVNAHSCMGGIEFSRRSGAYLHLRDEHGTWKRLFPMNNEGEATRLNDRNQIAYTELARDRWKPLRGRLPRWLVRPRRSFYPMESYLWDPVRGRIPLDRYLKGITGFLVADLNNNGCIVGTGNREDGSRCSVLLEPIPERWGK
jgi:probable HAF family extracellular repeat protein